MRPIIRESKGSIKPGQDLVVAGYAGLEGSITLVRSKEGELLERFSSGFLDSIKKMETELILGPVDWASLGATEWEAAGEGGIMTALWNLSGAYGTGISVVLRDLPLKQETIEICEVYDLNPYRLQSGGCYLLAADNGGGLVRRLADIQIPAVTVGTVDTGIKRQILNGEVRSFLDRPREDELRKIVPLYYEI